MKKHHSAYKIFMSALSIISIYFAIADISNQVNIVNNKHLLSMDIFIWIIFCIDYFYKLYLSEDKVNYIKTNKLDALSMIPVPILNIYFSNGFISFLRLFRTLSFLDEIRDNFKIFAKHKGVIYAVYIFFIKSICAFVNPLKSNSKVFVPVTIPVTCSSVYSGCP